MSVTLDIPPDILERAGNYAASEGIPLEVLIVRYLESLTPQSKPQPLNKFGLFLGSVTYMADDFNETPEEFKDYLE